MKTLLTAVALATLFGCSVTNAQQTTADSENCLFTGRVTGLDPYGDNNLSVRQRPYGPSGQAYEKDELFTEDQVCVTQTAGRWLFVRYSRGGRMFSGWVYDRYIRED